MLLAKYLISVTAPLKHKILAKKYRGVIFHDPEDGCKIWRKTDLLFQKWQEFSEIWPEHSKVYKTCTFICSYCAKYLMFDLKKYRWVIFHETEEGYKIWRGIVWSFQNWHKEFDKFWPEYSKVSKIFTLTGSFWAKLYCLSLKFTEALFVMTQKNDTKIEYELNCRF